MNVPITQTNKKNDSKINVATLKDTKIENSSSYESDDFEDVSASGSGSKSKLVHWPGKEAFVGKAADTKLQPKKQEDKFDANAMEAYMKKQ